MMDNNNQRCRLCAEYFCSKDCISVLNDSDLSRTIFQLFQIKIGTEDRPRCLPTTICKVCHDMTIKIWDFNDRIQKAQHLLEQHLNNELQIASDNRLLCETTQVTKNGEEQQMHQVVWVKDNDKRSKSNEETKSVKVTKKKSSIRASAKRKERSGNLEEQLREEGFTCGTCGKQFRMQSTLVVHARCHLPAEVKNRYHCDQCPKRFGTKPNLMAHKRIHSGVRDYTCDQCGKSFVQKGNLDNHLLTHTMARPFQCTLCSKTFKTLVRLRKHHSVHSGVKPHRCDVCGRHFREKGTLNEHIRIHTGAMPFTCEFCGKCFRFKGVLTTHRRQHTGERPYSCAECQHHFTNWPNYNKHMKRRHGINTSVTCRTKQDIPPTGMPHRNQPAAVQLPLAPVQSQQLIHNTATTPIIIQEDATATGFVDDEQPTHQQPISTFYPVLNLYNIPEELLLQQRI